MTSCTNTKFDARLLFLELPEIQKDPQDIYVNFGEAAMFSCVVTGEPNPEIVWLRDSNEIPIDGTRYEITNNGSLMVHDIREADSGFFECMAKNSVGEVHSKPAKMTVKPKPVENGNDIKIKYLFYVLLRVFKYFNINVFLGPPELVVQPSRQFAKIGQQLVTFDCVARGHPKPHIVWLFDGQRILLNERILIRYNGSLFIQNIQDTDAGLYTCIAENVNGKLNATAPLEVMGKFSHEFNKYLKCSRCNSR